MKYHKSLSVPCTSMSHNQFSAATEIKMDCFPSLFLLHMKLPLLVSVGVGKKSDQCH